MRKNELNQIENLRFEQNLFKGFYFKITRQFDKKPNRNRVYLKYDN